MKRKNKMAIVIIFSLVICSIIVTSVALATSGYSEKDLLETVKSFSNSDNGNVELIKQIEKENELYGGFYEFQDDQYQYRVNNVDDYVTTTVNIGNIIDVFPAKISIGEAEKIAKDTFEKAVGKFVSTTVETVCLQDCEEEGTAFIFDFIEKNKSNVGTGTYGSVTLSGDGTLLCGVFFKGNTELANKEPNYSKESAFDMAWEAINSSEMNFLETISSNDTLILDVDSDNEILAERKVFKDNLYWVFDIPVTTNADSITHKYYQVHLNAMTGEVENIGFIPNE